jgi:uncharacterized membrane protein
MNYQQHIIDEPVGNFRSIGRMGLRGRVKAALIAGFLYYLMLSLPQNLIEYIGGLYGVGDDPSAFTLFQLSLRSASTFEQIMACYEQFLDVAGPVFMITGIYMLLVSGPLRLGLSALCLRYLRRQEGESDVIFSGLNNFPRALGVMLLTTLFTMFWSFLFIVPGIVAIYRYRLAFYILADNPQISPLDAIRASKDMMRGNKLKLLILDLTFIRWALLAGVVMLIASRLLLWIFAFILPTSGLGAEIAIAMIESVVSAGAFGLFYMYQGTAVAAFYERAGGLRLTPSLGEGAAS